VFLFVLLYLTNNIYYARLIYSRILIIILIKSSLFLYGIRDDLINIK